MKLIKTLGILEYGKTGRRTTFGIYECTYCFEDFQAMTSKIKSKQTIKCPSCYKKDRRSMPHLIKHGDSKSKLYAVRNAMIQRCTNKNSKAFKDYGSRGINVCSEWINSYITFKDWALSNGYIEGLTIERINNDGNYEPSNCKWITNSEQKLNTRKSIKNRFTEDELSNIIELFYNTNISKQELSKILNLEIRGVSKILEEHGQISCAVQQIDKDTNKILKTFKNQKEAAKYIGIKSISSAICGIKKTAGGFIWKQLNTRI